MGEMLLMLLLHGEMQLTARALLVVMACLHGGCAALG